MLASRLPPQGGGREEKTDFFGRGLSVLNGVVVMRQNKVTKNLSEDNRGVCKSK